MIYLLHGFLITSDIPLPGAVAAEGNCEATAEETPDLLMVEWAPPRPVPEAFPKGPLLSRLDLPGGGSGAVRTDDGYLLRVLGVADFEISSDLRRVRVLADPERGVHLAPLLVSGGLISFLLGLKGEAPLHASAVALPGRGAVAVAGGPGAGKSTLAGLLCAAGGRLVTDDLLRWHDWESEILCERGGRELRLRDGVRAVADLIPGAESEEGPDGRLQVRPPPAAELTPLDAILLPRFESEGGGRRDGEWRLSRLPPVSAAGALGLVPRSAGWLDRTVLAAHLRRSVALARAVSVYELTLPRIEDWPAAVARVRVLLEAGV